MPGDSLVQARASIDATRPATAIVAIATKRAAAAAATSTLATAATAASALAIAAERAANSSSAAPSGGPSEGSRPAGAHPGRLPVSEAGLGGRPGDDRLLRRVGGHLLQPPPPRASKVCAGPGREPAPFAAEPQGAGNDAGKGPVGVISFAVSGNARTWGVLRAGSVQRGLRLCVTCRVQGVARGGDGALRMSVWGRPRAGLAQAGYGSMRVAAWGEDPTSYWD